MAGIKHYIDQLYRLSNELQSTAYGLSNHAVEVEKSIDVALIAQRSHSYAGCVARLRSQCEHTLEELERLLYALEEAAPT